MLDHQSIIVSGHIRNPISDPKIMEQWLTELVSLVGMKILIPAQAVYCNAPGNEGATGIVCLETSHAAIHIWEKNEKPFVKFDLYSCAPFETQTVLSHFNVMDPIDLNIMRIDRNNSITVTEQRGIYYG
jgi:S-adenosylmethionine/arginine decarboxylase-like enzyme